MTTVTVTIQGPPAVVDWPAELTLTGVPGGTIVLPITDPAAEYGMLSGNWVEVARPGRDPLNMRAGGNLPTIKITVTLAAPDGGVADPAGTVEPIIERLRWLAANDVPARPIAFTWGHFDSNQVLTATGHWHVQEFTLQSTLRQPITNTISRATATITLKAASDPPSGNGQRPVGWNPPPPAHPVTVTNPPNGGSLQLQTVTVAAGDTAYSLAAKIWGNPEPGWRLLLASNGIADPTSLQPGQVLAVP